MSDIHTNRVLDTQTIELRLCETAPYFGLVNLCGVLNTTVEGNDVLDQDVDRRFVVLVLLVDEEGFLVQAVVNRNLGNLIRVVVLELVNVANHLALVCTDGSEHEEVLEVLVLVEWRRLQDNLLEQFDELDGEISRQEGLDSDRDIIRIG